ncbi:hypothetical protein VTP21DRAFT_10821 [Calcarisporiella thermophila]
MLSLYTEALEVRFEELQIYHRGVRKPKL